MINTAYLPNIFFDDFLLTIKVFFQPWIWQKGGKEDFLKKELEKILGGKVFLFASGRGALFWILKSLGIKSGDEVIVQAFTCCAVVNPVVNLGAKPVYVDIDDSYNLDTSDLRKKITPKTKVIIIQHTFGIPANIKEILKIKKEKNIFIIEDLAHSFGGEFEGKKLGTFGDAAFLSFGRTKVLSSMFGGAAVIRETALPKNKDVKEKMKGFFLNLQYPPKIWILRQLLHQIIFYIFSPIYDLLGIGKFLLFVLSRLGILSKEVEGKEKKGLLVNDHFKKMPNALCILALNQLKKLKKIQEKRKEISNYYQENLDKNIFHFPTVKVPYLRFPILVKKKKELLTFAKKRGVYLGDWYSHPVSPFGVDLKKVFYKIKSCQKTEELNEQIINLPTNPTLTIKKLKKVIEVLNEFNYQGN